MTTPQESCSPLLDANTWDVLIDQNTLHQRVIEMGAAITRDFADKVDENNPLYLVTVLKGAFIFCADLVRAIQLPVCCEFIGISSYENNLQSSGVVKITADLNTSIEHRHVVLVEDIVDTGLTMSYLLDNMATRKPQSLRVCTLLHKPERCRVEVPLHYVGFVIPDRFVVGYGLDYQGLYRNLPYLSHLKNT
jgi:hypoxanthine phosphoribosyltransferase